MSSRTFYRLSGFALIIGFLPILIGQSLEIALPPSSEILKYYTDPLFMPSQVLFIVGVLLQILGFPGLYARQSERAGILGALGFTLSFVGMAVLEFASDVTNVAVFPGLVSTPQGLLAARVVSIPPVLLLFFPLMLLGFLLFGIATLRAKTLPRGVGAMLLVGVLVTVVSIPFHLSLIDTLGLFFIHGAMAYGGFMLVRGGGLGVSVESPPLHMSAGQ
jgi:hypothetical protein